MSIALDPIVTGYHPAESHPADWSAKAEAKISDSHATVDSRASNRFIVAGVQVIYVLSVLTAGVGLLAFAGWQFLDLLTSMAVQWE